MSIKSIAVVSKKLKNNSNQIKKLASLQVISLLIFSMVVAIIPKSVRAESNAETTPPAESTTEPSDSNQPPSNNSQNGNTEPSPVAAQPVAPNTADPNISGGANISGYAGSTIAVSPITPIQVTSSTDPVTVQVSAPSGNLSMTTTTGLTFDGPDTGSIVKFSGSVADINNALVTLKYQNLTAGTYTISAQVLDSGEIYNPINQSYYQIVSGSVTYDEALTNAAAITYKTATGHLLTINSQQESDFVLNRAVAASWLAATDTATEGDWRWAAGPESGSLFWTGGPKGGGGQSVGGLYNNWGTGEPSNSGGIENCGAIYAGNPSWNDTDCGGSLGSYIAEFEGATLPPSVSLQATISTAPTTNINVSNCDELQDIAADPGTYWYNNITITNDIDCSDYVSFTPLFNDQALAYRGTFDGNSHSISNVAIDGGNNVGLFGYTEQATVKNIAFSGSSISGDQCVGSIVGSAKNSNIENNSSSANILITGSSEGYGGIVGCYESNTIATSYAVRGNSYSGTLDFDESSLYGSGVSGILGRGIIRGSSVANIDNNNFSGQISSSYFNTGGVVGSIEAFEDAQSTINSNSITGTIIDSSYNTGGIIGYIDSYDSALVSVNSNNFGESASIIDSINNVGGIAGSLNTYDSANLKLNYNNIDGIVGGNSVGGYRPSYNTGGAIGYSDCESVLDTGITCEVVGNTNNSSIYIQNYYAGGIVGYIYNTANTLVESNINHGEVRANNSGGGIIGYTDNEYYDEGLDAVITIQNNLNDGAVILNNGDAGGITGYVYTYNYFDNTDVTTNITGNTVIARVEANNYSAGGVVGAVEGNADNGNSEMILNISDNTVNGPIYSGSEAGGIVGSMSNIDDSGSNAYTINIDSNSFSGDVESDGDNLGGLLGYAENYNVNLNATSNAVSADVLNGSGANTSGLIGNLYNGNSVQTQIYNNSVDGTINGYENTAGVLGYMSNYSNSSALIEGNTNLSSTVSNDGVASGVVGFLSNQDSKATIYQNLNEGNIESAFSNAAGVVGYATVVRNTLDVELDIKQNINRGSITANADKASGVVADINVLANDSLATVNIYDNYNTGSINAYNYAGGILANGEITNSGNEGSYTTLNMARNYNNSSVSVNNIFTGGLIGSIVASDNANAVLNLQNSFATGGPVTAGEGGAGIADYLNFPAPNSPNLAGLYFDQSALGQSVCTNSGYNCNAINTDGSQPDYFKNNTANAPLNTWNFSTTWGTQPTINDGLPCLQWENPICNPAGDNDGDGITNEVENAAPNNGDANNDGILDYRQPKVTSLVDSLTGKYTLIQATCTQNSSVYNEAESTTNRDKEFDYPVGLTGFTTTCPTIGATAKVSYYVYGSFNPSTVTVRKYNPNTGSYATVSGAQVGNTTIGGQQVLLVEYFVTDGGEFDIDGVDNGVIVDPVGIGTTTTIAPNTGYGRI